MSDIEDDSDWDALQLSGSLGDVLGDGGVLSEDGEWIDYGGGGRKRPVVGADGEVEKDY